MLVEGMGLRINHSDLDFQLGDLRESCKVCFFLHQMGMIDLIHRAVVMIKLKE